MNQPYTGATVRLTSMCDVNHVAMTNEHLTRGRTTPLRAIVLHATAGSAPGDFNWLKQGGDVQRKVSTHYYIDKAGVITQFVADHDTAWHAGVSAWEIDGKRQSGLNPWSIGIELSNRNDGKDPYPQAQLDAAVCLVRRLVALYDIPRSQLVRHLDIAPGRKSDPRGLDWAAFVEAVYREEPSEPVEVRRFHRNSALNVLEIPSLVHLSRIAAAIDQRSTLSAFDVFGIVTTYADVCKATQLMPYLVIAQMLHETDWLRSFWSQPPQHNMAGIGVNGVWSSVPAAGMVWNPQRNRYEVGLSFPDYPTAIEAHVGRLLAYVLPEDARNADDAALIAKALAWRALPKALHGTAGTPAQLGAAINETGNGWAYPGSDYGERIAAIAEGLWRL